MTVQTAEQNETNNKCTSTARPRERSGRDKAIIRSWSKRKSETVGVQERHLFTAAVMEMITCRETGHVPRSFTHYL